jgi:hypothetical protein
VVVKFAQSHAKANKSFVISATNFTQSHAKADKPFIIDERNRAKFAQSHR